MKYLPLCLLALLLLSAYSGVLHEVESRPAPPSTSVPDWDNELDTLNVSWEPAADCSNGCWRLTWANLLDPIEGNGNHHVYTRLRQDGELVMGLPWNVAWTDGSDRAVTKAPPEWADIPLWSCYYPDNGPGPYRAYAGDYEAQSDVIHGMGLPVCYHYSFQLEWEWVDDPSPSSTEVPSTPTTAVTVTPCEECLHLWLPLLLLEESPPTTATPVASSTPVVASPTPLATATAGNPEGDFTGQVVQTFVNCGLTQVIGVVHDPSEAPLLGVRLRLTWDAPDAQTFYTTAGSYVRPETDASGWEFFLNHYNVANSWRVAVVDDGGQPLSEEVQVVTAGHCNPGAANVVKVKFQEQQP